MIPGQNKMLGNNQKKEKNIQKKRKLNYQTNHQKKMKNQQCQMFHLAMEKRKYVKDVVRNLRVL